MTNFSACILTSEYYGSRFLPAAYIIKCLKIFHYATRGIKLKVIVKESFSTFLFQPRKRLNVDLDHLQNLLNLNF